jgi:argininosuccinate synthase
MAKLKEKVVLAYSGGLDTTAIIPWLREHFDYEVICCCVDCGQDSELRDLEERAKLAGASKLYLFDENDSFADDYILPCLQAGLDTEQAALLGNALSRPLIAQKLVELARKEHAVAICHGATGKGNDQVRFELSVKALAPELKVIAPWRMTELWPFRSREDELAYCRQKGIDLPFDASHAYSHDRNLWHSSHEGLELEDPAQEPMFEELLRLGVSPKQAPDTETLLRIGFEEGVPVSLDGKRMKFSDLLRKLNEIGGKNGIGIFDIVEDRVVGMKARGIYEIPGIAILLEAKRSLEALVLDGDTLATRRPLGEKYASLLYAGKWFTPLREALQAFFASTQSTVSGEVRLRLYKGNLIRAGASSVFSLYAEDVASFTTGSLYRHRDADGFIALFGLPLELRARMLQRAGVAEEESTLMELPALPLPVKTTVSKVKKADKKQAVGKVAEKKKSGEKTPEKKKAVKKETAKKTAEKKTGAKKVTRKVAKKAPEKK